MRNVLVTGVSMGLGHGFARALLEDGERVYGLSRREPEDLPGMIFRAMDLADFDAVPGELSRLLDGLSRLDLLILNAGVLGEIRDMRESPLADLKNVMDVNLWSNKVLLDAIFESGIVVTQVVAISSGAAVNGNRGWSGYSISKAAFLMMMKLYEWSNWLWISI